MVDLKRRVLDAVLAQEHVLELAPARVAILISLDEDMRGEGGEAGRDRPDVQVVHLDDPRHLGQTTTEPAGIHAPRGSLEQDVHGVAQDRPGAREDQERDRHAGKRVGVAPAREQDDDGGNEDSGRADCVGEHVSERRAHVQGVVPSAVEDCRSREVDGEAGDGHEGNPAGQHLGRVGEPAPRLDEDPDGKSKEDEAVDERCEDLGALVAEAPLRRARPACEPDRQEGHSEGEVVREHVRRVREEREASGQQAADDLDRRERERQREHDREDTPVSGSDGVEVRHEARIVRKNPSMDIRELMKLEVDPAEVEAVYELWKQHSIAEDNRDIAGLLATLTEDCVYRIIGAPERWEGHEGATRFYMGLLTAFPDIDFQLTDIVVGPQGVCEEARVTGTHEGDWLGWKATGEPVEFNVVIFFPWDREQRLFRGEKVYVYAEGSGLGSDPRTDSA